MRGKATLALVAALAGTLISAGWDARAQAGPGPNGYADEAKDWGVPPTQRLRKVGYHAPTPPSIPGGRAITTVELQDLLAQPSRPYLIDVLGGGVHRTIAGAFWMVAAGPGDLDAEEEKRFAEAIAGFAAGDKNRPMVFFCVDAECWLSYNAALRAIGLGYTNVMWYRGGIAAWRAAGLRMQQSDPFFW